MNATKFFIILAVLAVLITGGYLGLRLFDRLCTELAITHFRASPSQIGAQTLAELVDDGSATPGQVDRILPLLFTPKVSTEKTYPLGTVPRIRVERAFEVVFKNLVVDVNEFVWVDGASQYGTGMTGAHTVRTDPHPLHLHPNPVRPGTYHMEIRYRYRLRPQRVRRWRWNPGQGIVWPRKEFVDVPEPYQNRFEYECEITVPVKIVVVRVVQLQKGRASVGP